MQNVYGWSKNVSSVRMSVNWTSTPYQRKNLAHYCLSPYHLFSHAHRLHLSLREREGCQLNATGRRNVIALDEREPEPFRYEGRSGSLIDFPLESSAPNLTKSLSRSLCLYALSASSEKNSPLNRVSILDTTPQRLITARSTRSAPVATD